MDTLLLVSGMDAPDPRIQTQRNVINAARGEEDRLHHRSGSRRRHQLFPVIQSNRHTEADIRASGLDLVIGRNSIYIEPYVECIDNYRKSGEIANCARDTKCGYMTRPELAQA